MQDAGELQSVAVANKSCLGMGQRLHLSLVEKHLVEGRTVVVMPSLKLPLCDIILVGAVVCGMCASAICTLNILVLAQFARTVRSMVVVLALNASWPAITVPRAVAKWLAAEALRSVVLFPDGLPSSREVEECLNFFIGSRVTARLQIDLE